MPDASQVTTLIVATSILALALALVLGGGFLWLAQGDVLLGLGLAAAGLVVGVGALLFTLAPLVARRYDPEGGDEDPPED